MACSLRQQFEMVVLATSAAQEDAVISGTIRHLPRYQRFGTLGSRSDKWRSASERGLFDDQLS